MHLDVKALEASGYTVLPGKSFSGFRECIVTMPIVGRTGLQWTRGLTSEFYAPVRDPLTGFRLHFADLAVNRTLAAGSRIEKRDFVDLWMLDKHVLPLWRMACGARGKGPDFSPFSHIERISRNWYFAAQRADRIDRLVLTLDFSLQELGTDLRNSIDEALFTLNDVPPECYGCLE